MKNILTLAVLIGSFCIYCFSQNTGCTTFSLIENQREIFGRNLDTESEFGYVFINKRNMSKTAYFDSTSTETPVSWVSQYGSITFNQISCDIPHGGMNENGLVVEHMFLASANYPPADGRPATISHQWVQFILDNYGSVAEAVSADTLVRISDTEYKFPIHFHLMDSTGDRAIIEFLADTFTVYRGSSYTACALANNSYAYSCNVLSNYTGWGGSTPIPVNVSASEDRFVKAADMVNSYPGSGVIPMIDYSFQVLDSVWENTKWQLVYDLDNLTIQYRILSDATIRTLDFSTFDFNCDSGTKLLELGDDPAVGANWKDYSTALNTTLINTVCSVSSFVNSILGTEADDIAVYPESAFCTTTAINENSNYNTPIIYPNPTSGLIHIEADNIEQVEVLNQMGQLIYSGEGHHDIDLSSQPAGVYFVRVLMCDDTKTIKVLKQ